MRQRTYTVHDRATRQLKRLVVTDGIALSDDDVLARVEPKQRRKLIVAEAQPSEGSEVAGDGADTGGGGVRETHALDDVTVTYERAHGSADAGRGTA